MRSSIAFALSAVVGLVAAQGTLPQCALNCIGNLPANCNGQPTCICTDKTYLANVSCCIATGCSTADQSAALAYAQNLCGPAGASLPSSASCAPGASSATASGTDTGSMTVMTTGTVTSTGTMTMTSSGSSATTTTHMSSTMTSTSASAASTSSGSPGNKLAADSVGILGALVGAIALL